MEMRKRGQTLRRLRFDAMASFDCQSLRRYKHIFMIFSSKHSSMSMNSLSTVLYIHYSILIYIVETLVPMTISILIIINSVQVKTNSQQK